ncbi:Sec20-domain-containing protein [Phlebopus sp. FC_14]|nr:Sec20-domain-containing protein [Phlebopus sp. FC_14]
MPPIPTTLDPDALALLEAIQRRQNDLSDFQIPRLRACTGSLATQQLWAAEVREDMEGLARQIEELDVLVDDQRTERPRKQLRLKVDALRETLQSLRKEARTAVLTSKRAIEAQSRSQREELLRSSLMWEKKEEVVDQKTTEETAVTKTTTDLTHTLQRTVALMQQELERSVLSAQLLDSSTSTLQSASRSHDAIALVLGTSKQLVTALEKTDWMDRVLLILGLVCFGLVVLFILKQRIVDRGLRIAFWWMRFIPGAKMKAGEPVSSAFASASAVTGVTTSPTIVSISASPTGMASALTVGASLRDSHDTVFPTSISDDSRQRTIAADASTTSTSYPRQDSVHVEL